ncbi:Rpn family recombination-promoting nuclease/putative transposase [Wolbachia pipientis]|uniref:Rpn family recombination-promoting nuclease/putative transposase n=1 Tax=Wolbachia pipientis TaxID=955 RepID=UPI00165159CA|nr:Rpn family recombination-promoting nuclease/putative transposase [Wolbachia pipientis]MBC6685959.1 Rpn family recombination-promoting nuclease/putative transposase [Wolbachia pipientis]
MALSKFLDARNDYAFKRIFGTEKNKDILIHFLNDILGFTGLAAIHDVEFLATILDPEIAAKKQSIVDVLCKDSQGSKYIIEMQFTKTKGFEKRAQLYAAKAYSRQLDKSGNYIDLQKVFFIAISNCNLLPKEVDYISTHNIRDIKTNGHYLKDLQFVFIELPKFTKNRVEQLENRTERWCFFFKYAEETTEEDLKKIAAEAPIIKLAYDELDRFRWNEKDLIAYEERILSVQKEKAILAQKLDDATQKGILIGHEKGRKERNIEVAKNLLKAGVSIDIISQTTGLPQAEIAQLKEEIS